MDRFFDGGVLTTSLHNIMSYTNEQLKNFCAKSNYKIIEQISNNSKRKVEVLVYFNFLLDSRKKFG